MSRHEIQVPLWDIVDAGERVLRYTAGKNRDDYERDEILRLAVERLFITIGEALRRTLSIDPNVRITDAAKVIAFRNILAHRYERISNDDVWAHIQDHLPLLLSECRSILGELPA
ncbi:MAG TPA: DUF86 domain-containing protein [Thermoanaerobaculia bacterium]|jgi:uncharacterized protein with HEPN domain|nr:DUF86 domain-containing protein [Thermoanaerobaculia bacterium]